MSCSINHFHRMEIAVKAQESSPHSLHKVGAAIFINLHDDHEKSLNSKGKNGKTPNNGIFSDYDYCISRPNKWPALLAQKIGKNIKLGNASTTIHAEIAAILDMPHATDGAYIYVTELPCPNCAKALAESGIKKVFIDSRAKYTKLGQKMAKFFNNISKPIFKCAGIDVLEINMARKEIANIVTHSQDCVIQVEKPVEIRCIKNEGDRLAPNYPEKIDKIFKDLINEAEGKYKGEAFTVSLAKDIANNKNENYSAMIVRPHMTVGIDEDEAQKLKSKLSKYSLILQPLNRALIYAARRGLKICPDYIYSAHVPTSREFVNLIGGGYTKIWIGNKNRSRNKFGITAMRQLEENGIIEIK